MNVIAELALIFGICLAGEGIAAILPVKFPGTVIGMILLIVLLFTGVIKKRHIQRVAEFLVANMSFVFLPPCVAIMEHFEAVKGQLLPIFAICFLTTPLVYAVTAWTVQAMMLRRRRGKEGEKHV